MNLEETEKIKKFIQKKFLTGSKNAIECFIFLYFHREKTYSDREIWENIKDLILSPGKTDKTDSTPEFGINSLSHTILVFQ